MVELTATVLLDRSLILSQIVLSSAGKAVLAMPGGVTARKCCLLLLG